MKLQITDIEHIYALLEVVTNAHSIRGVMPNIVSRIAGTKNVGLVTEVERKTLAFPWI